MIRKKKPSILKQVHKQKQKMKMAIVIASTASILGMVAGIFIYLNFSQSQKSKAQTVTSQYQNMLPVDFYQTEMVKTTPDKKLNGVNYKEPKQIPAGQTTVIESIYGQAIN